MCYILLSTAPRPHQDFDVSYMRTMPEGYHTVLGCFSFLKTTTMPTVHYISRETLKKHGIGHIPWELMNDALTAGNSNSSSKKRRVTTVTDRKKKGGINATDTAANSEVQQPSYKSTGMGNDINVQESRNIFPPSSSSSILNDNQPVQQTRPIIEEIDKIKEDECHEPSNVDKDKRGQYKSFFARVDELKAYKEKHGHLNVRPKDDQSLYNFCGHVRQARIGKGTYRLDDGRVSALEAIGFDWNPGISKDDKFFAQVDKLKFYKHKHGHLTVRRKEDRSLYDFCCRLKRSRRAIIAGKRKKMDYRLDGDRIAALDAIGFEWELDCKV